MPLNQNTDPLICWQYAQSSKIFTVLSKTHFAIFILFYSPDFSNPWFSTVTQTHTQIHRHREQCFCLKSLRPAKWYKCRTQCLGLDQQIAHQQRKLIPISCVLLGPLPPVNQTSVLHQEKGILIEMTENTSNQKEIGIRPIWPICGLRLLAVYCCGVQDLCVRLFGSMEHKRRRFRDGKKGYRR